MHVGIHRFLEPRNHKLCELQNMVFIVSNTKKSRV